MCNVGQKSRGDIVARGGCTEEVLVLRRRIHSALGQSILDLCIDVVLSSAGNDWPNHGVCLEGITELVPDGSLGRGIESSFWVIRLPLELLLNFTDKGIVHISMDIYTLNSTAALAGIEDSAINQLSGDVLEVGIRSNIGRIITPKLQVDRNGASTGGFTNGQTADCGTGKADEAELRELDKLLQRFRIPRLDDLKDILGQASLVEDIDEVLCNERCLGGRFEDNRVSS